jgi:hypothetical protein
MRAKATVRNLNESPTVGEEQQGSLWIFFYFLNKLWNILVIHVFKNLIKNFDGSTITGSILIFLIN